jgi:SAM-dependent methyltransferase
MKSEITQRVRDFYEALPFNYYGSLSSAANQIKANPLRIYPDLDRLLSSKEIESVLDIGCGTGWFANAVAYHYSKSVLGVDMTAHAVCRAREIAHILGTEKYATFVQSDLFDFFAERPVDLVVSIGVLHHTHDAKKAFRHIQQFVAKDKYIFIGLYHLYGRKVFRDMFQEVLEGEGEEAAFQRYKSLHATTGDDTLLRSWFRDQVLHPYETLHTLEEVLQWFDESGFILRSTSINQFKKFYSTAELTQMEKGYEEISRRRNWLENRYFPGFFTALAQKCC